MESGDNSYHWLWLSLALMVILFLASLLPLIPNDYWWYVRLGNDILAGRAVPGVDTYSFTRYGQPVVYQSWFSAVVLAWVYETGGVPLTFLLRALVLGITYALLWKVARGAGAGPRLATVLVLSAALAGSNNWSHRPQLFTYVLFVWALSLLWDWDQGKDKSTGWLVLISLAWANLHGSFVLFFILAGIAWAFGKGDRSRLAFALVLSAAATLLNPRGPALWVSVLETFLAPGSRNLSAEWAPPVNAGWQMGMFFAWLLLFAPLAARSPRKLPVLGWAWFLAFGWLALSGMRYVIWFLFLLVPLTALLAKDWAEGWLDRPVAVRKPALNYLLGGFFILLPLLALPGVRETWWRAAPPAISAGTPLGAMDWLAAHESLPGELWSDIHFASYQIYALPARRVWIDTRIQVVYPLALFDEYATIASASPGWEALLDRDHVNLLLLSPDSQSRLVSALAQNPAWCPLYEDEMSVIYAHVQEDVPCLR